MKDAIQLIAWGLLVWVIPFAIGMMLFSIKDTTLFDSIMSVSLAGGASTVSLAYSRRRNSLSSIRYACVGVAWMVICLAIDLPMFLGGLGWTPGDYFSDIGVEYLAIPIIAFAIGRARSREIHHANSDRGSFDVRGR